MAFTLANHMRASAVFTRAGEDAVMNTFWFSHAPTATRGAVELAIQAALNLFYMGLAPSQVATIRQRLSSLLLTMQYRFHWNNDLPQSPDTFLPSTYTPYSVTTRLPPQLAVASSYRADPPNTARRRGRLYIGPLNGDATNTANGNVEAGFRADLARATRDLAIYTPGATDLQWVIASRIGNVSAPIANGYVDGDFDTQDRRSTLAGLDTRTVWTPSGVT